MKIACVFFANACGLRASLSLILLAVLVRRTAVRHRAARRCTALCCTARWCVLGVLFGVSSRPLAAGKHQ